MEFSFVAEPPESAFIDDEYMCVVMSGMLEVNKLVLSISVARFEARFWWFFSGWVSDIYIVSAS